MRFRLPGMPDTYAEMRDRLMPDLSLDQLGGQVSRFPALPGEEREDVEDSYLSGALSGLGYVGDSLDKIGARQVRGFLAGKPRELLSFIPFSDRLGITDPEQATSGRQLLEGYGMVHPESGFAGSLAGFGAEVVLDPMNWITFGGKSVLGQAAKRAGQMPKGLMRGIRGFDTTESLVRANRLRRLGPVAPELLDAASSATMARMASRGRVVMPEAMEQAIRATGYTGELRGPLREGLTFNPLFSGIHKPLSANGAFASPTTRWLANTVDQGVASVGRLPGLGRVSRFVGSVAEPVNARVRSLFDSSVGGTIRPEIQDAIAPVFVNARDRYAKQARQLDVALRTELEPVLQNVSNPDMEALGVAMRSRAEKIPEAFAPLGHSPAPQIPLLGRTPNRLRLPGFGLNPGGVQQAERIADSVSAQGLAIKNAEETLGLAVRDATDLHTPGYATRSLYLPPNRGGAGPGLITKLSHMVQTLVPSFRKRKDAFTAIPGGSQMIESLVRDPSVSTWGRSIAKPSQGVPYIFKKLLEAQTSAITPMMAREIAQNADDRHILRMAMDMFPQLVNRQTIRGRNLSMAQDISDNLPMWRELMAGSPVAGQALTNHVGIGPRLQQLIATDPAFAQQFANAALDPSRVERYFRGLPTKAQMGLYSSSVQGADLVDRSRHLFGYLGNLHPEHLTQPFWNPDLLGDLSRRMGQTAQAKAAAEATYNALGKIAKPTKEFQSAGTRHTTVDRALEEMALVGNTFSYVPLFPEHIRELNALGLTEDAARQMVKNGDQSFLQVASPGLKDRLQTINREGAMVQAARSLGIPLTQNQLRNLELVKKQLEGYAILPEQVADLQAFNRRWVTPHEVAPWLQGVDSLTSLFKGMSYAALPTGLSSQVRNLVGAVYNNAVSGALDPNRSGPMKFFGPLIEGHRLSRQGVFHGLTGLPGIDALPAGADRGRALLNHIYEQGVAFRPDLVNDMVGGGVPARAGSRPFAYLPNAAPRQPYAWMNRSSYNPLDQSGIGDRTVDQFIPVQAGRELGAHVENSARTAQYLGLIRSGWHPDEAANVVRKFQFDYGDLSQFEKQVMKRAFPFYTFTRKNLPLQLSLLRENPRLMKNQIRAMVDARGDEDWTPSYLGGGLAIRIGQPQDGQQNYLTGLGLPIEEAVERLKMSPKFPFFNAFDTAERYAGMLNPLVKFPLEQGLDRQFHTGRRLSDLKPTGIGSAYGALDEEKSQLLTNIISNSPAARFTTFLDRMTDPRKNAAQKALNLLTGVKFSTIDLERARAIDARAVLEDILQRSPGVSEFQEFYVPPEVAATMNPETQRLMQVFSAMKREARAAANAKRKIGVAGQPAR